MVTVPIPKSKYKQIIAHPKFVAKTLKTQVEDPKLVLIATEKAWRNKLFFWTIEKDFLEELSSLT